VAVLVAYLFFIADDDTHLSGTSHANMLSFLGHGSAAVPAPRAPTWPARAKVAAADLCCGCAALPSRAASALIAIISQSQGERQGPSPCMRFSLGAPRWPRPRQSSKSQLHGFVRGPTAQDPQKSFPRTCASNCPQHSPSFAYLQDWHSTLFSMMAGE